MSEKIGKKHRAPLPPKDSLLMEDERSRSRHQARSKEVTWGQDKEREGQKTPELRSYIAQESVLLGLENWQRPSRNRTISPFSSCHSETRSIPACLVVMLFLRGSNRSLTLILSLAATNNLKIGFGYRGYSTGNVVILRGERVSVNIPNRRMPRESHNTDSFVSHVDLKILLQYLDVKFYPRS